LDYEGNFYSLLSADDTVAYLSDFRKVSACLPGVESVEVQGNQYVAKIRFDVSEMGHSYISTLSGRIKAHYEDSESDQVVLSASGRVAGASLKILLHITISESEGKTMASWKASVDFGILMKVMGEKNIASIAEVNIGRIMSCIGRAINPI
jgi:carbon monoxide dehydrogenase subunit G